MFADDNEPDSPLEQATLNLSAGTENESAALLAVGTAEGTVEVVSVSEGAVQPLSLNIVHSFKVSGCASVNQCFTPVVLLFSSPVQLREHSTACHTICILDSAAIEHSATQYLYMYYVSCGLSHLIERDCVFDGSRNSLLSMQFV